jgi:hypothetical protein
MFVLFVLFLLVVVEALVQVPLLLRMVEVVVDYVISTI